MHKIKNITLIQLVALFLVIAPFKLTAYAAPAASDAGSATTSAATNSTPIGNGCAYKQVTAANEQKCLANNSVIKYLRIIINSLSAGVGIVVIAMIILGGIQYSAAHDNATAVSAAKKRITNAVIAMILYMLIFAFLQWLIPGGVFS